MDKKTEQKLKQLTVLYAEDEEGIRKNTASTLRYYVKEVIEAKDGLEAYEIYKNQKIDILFTDILMPNLNGIDLVKKIRKEDKNLAIVIISAHTDKDYLLEAIELKLEQYIIKPMNLKSLKASLKKCVDGVSKPMSQELVDGYSYEFDTRTIYGKQGCNKLTKKEALFFELMLKNIGKVVSYSEIEYEVWQGDIMSELALKSLVRNLRSKFCKECIKNHSGFGYKLEI